MTTNRLIARLGAALLAGAVSFSALDASASSHAEAPGTASDPDIDNADVWAWVQGSNLVVVATYNGLQPAFAGPNWKKFAAEGAMYEIHLTRGDQSLDDAITYQIKFQTAPYPQVDPGDLAAPVGGGKEFFSQISGGGNQTYTVTKIENGVATDLVTSGDPGKVAPPNIGARTNSIAYQIPGGTSYEQFFVDNGATSVVKTMGGGQGRVFAGPRDDAFYVDLGAVFDLAGLRTVLGGAPRDSVAYTNVMAIALEIPLQVANGGAAVTPGGSNAQTVGVWASASRRQVTILRGDGTKDTMGPYRQVSRLGLPLINEAVIGLQDKDRWNRTRPKDDVALYGAYFLNPVIVRDAQFAGFYGPGGPLAGCSVDGGNDLRANRLDIISTINIDFVPGHTPWPLAATGDVLRVDLGTASAFPNGRPLAPGGHDPDVVDVELSLLLCKLAAPVPDGVSQSEIANKATFPYLQTPWESFRGSVYPAPAL